MTETTGFDLTRPFRRVLLNNVALERAPWADRDRAQGWEMTTQEPGCRLLTIEEFREPCAALSVEQFGAVHGEAFLLHHGPLGRLKTPMSGATLSIESSEPATLPGAGLQLQTDFLVFPIMRPDSDGTRADMVWVGRSDFNEVVVPDASVSEVQAFIRREADGEFFIQDTGSRNGTFVGEKRVPAQGVGPPMRLPPGARIRLGELRLTFLVAEQFMTLVNRLLG